MESVVATKKRFRQPKAGTGKTRGAGRSRNWAAVLYPDSAAENWRDILSEMHVTVYVSPLHDKDKNPDGTMKKPHWHILVNYETVKSKEQAGELWTALKAVPEPCPVNSLRGYARYLCHLDNPEKAQYSARDVLTYGGGDYLAAIALPTDAYGTAMEIINYIKAEGIYSYAELVDRCIESGNDVWFNALCSSCSYMIGKYLKSLEWESVRGYVRAADRESMCVQQIGGET